MGTYRFTFDEDNLKEIKVICEFDNEEDKASLLETAKSFFINTLSEEIKPDEVIELDGEEVGYLIKSEEHGEELLTNIFRYTYVLLKAAKVLKDEIDEAGNLNGDFNVEFIKPYVEEIAGMGYRELAKLLGDYQEQN